MNRYTISLEDSHQFTKIILDYVNRSENLAPYYQLPPEISSYKLMMEQKNYDDSNRAILVNHLKEQYQLAGIDLKKNKQLEANIKRLELANTFTITTGHQLCAYTGPLYFIYKILSTIRWCETLQQAYPDKNFVPVFWMASEDHDFEEVNHINLNGQKLTWNVDSQQAPVGRISTNGFDAFADLIRPYLGNEFSRKQFETITGFYTSSKTLSEATLKMAHYLFGNKGLVVLDPDNAKLKELFIPYIKQDVLHQHNQPVLSHTNLQLKQQYKTQVNGRDINFFYLSESGRRLIKFQQGNFLVDGTDLSFSTESMEREIETHPERFSPNVVMRPLYQEVILPNLSYIGGPGEIAYWLQLKDVFQSNKIAFPILTLRNFILLIKEQHKRILDKAGLNPQELFLAPIEIERRLVQLNNDGGQTDIVQSLDNHIQQLINIANKTDNRISSELITYKTSWKKTLAALSSQLDKKQREKIKEQIGKILDIRSAYFPANSIQERFDNILNWGIHQDIHALIEQVYAEIDTHENSIKILSFHW